MTIGQQARFKAGSFHVNGTIISESVAISRDTGKNLTSWDVEFIADRSQHEGLQEALATGVGTLVAGNPPVEAPVSLYQKMHSSTMGDPRQRYTWMLTELEQLTLEALRLGDLSLKPYKCEYTFDGDALIITARVEVDEASGKALRALPLYFPVIREGISGMPRLMRFGRSLWSAVGEQRSKRQIVLVEKLLDEQRQGPAIMQPELGNIVNSLAATNARLRRLFAALEEKGMFTKEQIDSITAVSEDEIFDERWKLYQVADLDEFCGVSE